MSATRPHDVGTVSALKGRSGVSTHSPEARALCLSLGSDSAALTLVNTQTLSDSDSSL